MYTGSARKPRQTCPCGHYFLRVPATIRRGPLHRQVWPLSPCGPCRTGSLRPRPRSRCPYFPRRAPAVADSRRRTTLPAVLAPWGARPPITWAGTCPLRKPKPRSQPSVRKRRPPAPPRPRASSRRHELPEQLLWPSSGASCRIRSPLSVRHTRHQCTWSPLARKAPSNVLNASLRAPTPTRQAPRGN